jgi:LacI family transcriptional regulator
MPSSAPTVRSLARELGLSRTTVSDALRGAVRVDPLTVQRVQEAARVAGYQRNPLAAALMSELRRSRGATFRGVIASIDLDEPDRPATAGRFHRELVVGAASRGDELGFKVEPFSMSRDGLTVERLDSVLRSRGIHGVMLLPAWSDPDLSKLDWTRYAGVYTDSIMERPALHCVCSDHFRSMTSAMTRLASLGYRRPGLALHRHNDERLQNRWSGAFRAFQESRSWIEPVPILLADSLTRDEFTRWFRKTKPDIVLSHNTEVMDWMEECGARIPATHGFLSLNLVMKTRPCAGLDLQPHLLGARAAEILVAQLQRNEHGVPEWPATTTIPARWIDGPTLRSEAGPPADPEPEPEPRRRRAAVR